METADLTAWLGRPPPVPSKLSETSSPAGRSAQQRIPSHGYEQTATSDSSDVEEVEYRTVKPVRSIPVMQSMSTSESSDVDLVDPNMQRKPSRRRIFISVPTLSEEQKKGYTHMPGHFVVKQVLSENRQDGTYLVQRQSDEIEIVRADEFDALKNGRRAISLFERSEHNIRRQSSNVPTGGFVTWDEVDISDLDSDDLSHGRSKRQKRQETMSHESNAHSESSDSMDEDGSDESVVVLPKGRQSLRLAARPKRNKSVLGTELDDFDGTPRRTRRRRVLINDAKPISRASSTAAAHRSIRTRMMPKRSMRERHEDEISSASEEEVGPKIVGTKEVFLSLSLDDPFRQTHRQACDTCELKDEDGSKGPLVFCQGCTNAYHKKCLGFRGSRDHLVTKVSSELFVLQCRRCIGTAHDKDQLAPHLGHCTVCDETNSLAKPLRPRLTTRQEQLQREENGGLDPITHVNPAMINQPSNVMFRCVQCQRAWHMHHLPSRKTATLPDDDEGVEDLNQAELAQKRFDHYRRSWICKTCIEHPYQVDTIVSWRPVDINNYVPGTTLSVTPETTKEYLVKWRKQSYLRVAWVPGSWLWGTVMANMRTSFMKKAENALPKMTTQDAIPEEFFRIDIVFDVRYSSVVRNSTKEIDMVRAKEVESAFVKYKGLGYEDAIWEKPPLYTETERWADFKLAYEDYVTKTYMSIPPQSTLRRHLTSVRTREFEKLARKIQPTLMVGGDLMKYQLEGLNWLYWQWYRSHNAILADEMGLGKTIQLVAFCANMIQEHNCWPFLVVVPNSTCPNWRREVKKWAPTLRVVTYYGSERARQLTRDFELFPKDKDGDSEKHDAPARKRPETKDIKAHIVITSYESISEDRTRKSLLRVPWQGLIVDEGQRLKNDKNQIYDHLSKFHFPFKVLLTGTPLQNNARELFNLLQFLDKSKNAADLEAQYATLTDENVPELHDLLRPFFLRRTKVQVLTFLPPMAQIIIPLTMSTVQKRVYKSILAQNPQLMKAILSRENIAQKDRINLNNVLMQLRKTLCHPFVYSQEIEERTVDQQASHRGLVEASAKLQLLQVMLPKLQERGHRVLLFSQFLDNLDIMEDFLDGLGLLYRRLDGTIGASEKQKRIDEYNAPDSPFFAFLLSTRAGGVGINLASADTVIILDPDFNPHQDIQALSRAHRIGQKNKVLVFQLVTKSTAEEKIMAIGKKKMALDHILIERMDQDDDAGENLESILKYGAQALFEEQDEDDKIIYDAASIDRLLDRSQIEATKTSDKQSAESQFGYARVWANDKAVLEEQMGEIQDDLPVNTSIWDKILQEREKAFAEEQARKAETFGRGKRKRGQVDYNAQGKELEDLGIPPVNESEASDQDMAYDEPPSSPDDRASSAGESDMEPEPESTPQKSITIVNARPFQRVRIPMGPAPFFYGDGPSHHVPMGPLPPVHRCMACGEDHHIGWCRLKIAGVEHCGLCGLAHIGRGRTCPHLMDERQIETLLATLKESTEPVALIEEARRYLTLVRSNIISVRTKREAAQRAETEKAMKIARQNFRPASPPPRIITYMHPRGNTATSTSTGSAQNPQGPPAI